MSKSNGFLLSLILLLVSSSVSSPRSLVFGSPVREQRYNRPDPLCHFKFYNGVYDIRNKHYWISAAFTGVHGYVMAGFWILAGLGIGIFVVIKNLRSNSSAITEHSDSYYFIPFLVVVLFTILAIIASSFVLVANKSFLWRAKRLKQTLLGAAGDACRSIRKVTKAMKEMHHLLSPYDPTRCFQLKSTFHELDKEAAIIRREVFKRRRSFDLAIQTWYKTTAGIVSINLVLVVAALVLLLLHWRPGFIMIIFICWILTALCWFFTGLDFFLNTFAEDTCSAFEEFEQRPDNNSLSSVLPCMDPLYADRILVGIGSTVHNFIVELNSKTTLVGELLGLPKKREGLVSEFWKICDPFSDAPDYRYNPSNCPNDTIPISEIPDILAKFVCDTSNSSGACQGGQEFISGPYFEMAWAYTHSIQQLLNVFPDLQSLTQCSIVKDTFSDVLSHQCRPFKISIQLLWSSMISLSIIMVILELAWVAKAYQNRGRCFSKCSIVPNSIQQVQD